MIRDVFLALTDTASDEVALNAAAALAESCGARLSAAVPLDSPLAASASYGVTPIVLEESNEALREAARARAAHFRELLRPRDISADVHVAEARSSGAEQLIALEARYADIAVVAAAGPDNTDSAMLHDAFAALLFGSGRPVLTIPHKGDVHFPVRRAVIAWAPTPEATRAVHDALPLLQAGTPVDVLVIDPVIGDRHHGEDPGADIAGHLARHGLKVQVLVHRTPRGSIAGDVLVSAIESRADLVIAGGYGHSRAREWAFGGTTRELLWRSHVPVLFAH